MLITSNVDRKVFDHRVDALLGGAHTQDAEHAILLRRSLAALRPHELIALWFGHGEPIVPETCVDEFISVCVHRHLGRRPETPDEEESVSELRTPEACIVAAVSLIERITKIRKVIRRRSLLFAWVYGPGPATDELAHVRLPSPERQLFLDLVLKRARSRFPWLKRRLIYAMAFRPSAFSSLQRTPEGQEPWGPLYHRATIHAGSKSRHLWIPNPVLKRIQKCLLSLLQSSVDRALSPSVFGARKVLAGRPLSGPVYVNAAEHIHRSVIASFDVKDFFPSTTVSDVIRGMQHLAERHKVAVDASLLERDDDNDPDETHAPICWTDDLRVLVARLGTHRGRLPQGSPLSPLLANVAFSPYDDRLIKLLDQEFGANRVRYTRYFDDLTISAALPGTSTADDFRDRCKAVISRVLEGSSYRLNSRKSRASLAVEGHNVTGLVVRRTSVTLSRTARRDLRLTIHRLRNLDFVEAARRWRAATGKPGVEFTSILRGHRFQKGKLRSYRMSAERLATFMLRHLHPDLSLRQILRDWQAWQETVTTVEERVSGKAMWPLVEWVLAALWTGHLRAVRPTDATGQPVANRIILRQRDTDVCEIAAESTLDFFFLSRERAIAAVEYWHHLRGLHANLDACPKDPEFQGIRNAADNLGEAIAGIEIHAVPEQPASAPVGIPRPPITGAERFSELANQFESRWRHHPALHGVPTGPDFGSIRDTFRNARAVDWPSYLKWIDAAHALTTGLCPLLPAADTREGGDSGSLLYQYLRVRSALSSGLRSGEYACVTDFERKYKMTPGTSATRFSQVQVQILESLLAAIGSQRTIPNPWFGDITDRLRERINEFEQLHHQAMSSEGERRLFRRETALKELADFRDEALRSPDHLVWSSLEVTAKKLFLAIVEAMEPEVCETEPPVGEPLPANWKRKQLWQRSRALLSEPGLLKLIEDLRNRESHGRSPERREEWVSVQKKVARALGRTWTSASGAKHPTFIAPDDLTLTPYEGQIFKLMMLMDVTRWLQKIVEDQWWRPKRLDA
jgi:hypothetical protein